MIIEAEAPSFEDAATSELHDERPSRRENFAAGGPLDIEVAITSGRVTVNLVDEQLAGVEIVHEPGTDSPFMQGLSNIMDWVSDQFGDQRAANEELAKAAVEESRIDLLGQRLVVTGPKQRLRMVSLAVTVRAPSGSNVTIRSGSADVTVTGAAGRCTVETGSGEIAIDRADGYASVAAGSGALRLGPMLGGLKARSGSGEIEVSSVGGPATVSTGSGDVWFGAVQDNVSAKTGTGDLTIADAASGDIDLTTGSGEIRVGVRAGTTAMIDLVSRSGQARSELDVRERPRPDAPKIRLRARTSSGNVVVTPAVG
ncbi:MAG TPA: DUF4097 family beta strand repeat-containing protein [Pseudonocardiaceae bacterium]|nr:DUF4097 family beta strand repeat-containing protein [Pseudonocardiaceae bacterium]